MTATLSTNPKAATALPRISVITPSFNSATTIRDTIESVLQQNYPNPFNPVTKINFAVDKPGNVDVRVFNTRGELVKTITNQWYPQGEHFVSWDGKTQSGGHAPSGIYYIRAKSGGATDVIKAVLAK